MDPITFAAARENQRRNRAVLWHAEGKSSSASELYAYDRLGTSFFEPYCTPKFSLPADGAYFMMGSCFARGLEATLKANGFDVRSLTKAFDRFVHAGSRRRTLERRTGTTRVRC